MRFVESLIGSLGIMLFGWVSIPLTAWLVGASVSAEQGFLMGLIFFVLRLLWLYALRVFFSRHHVPRTP